VNTLCAPMTSPQIYIHRSGNETGPYSMHEIRSHLRSGALAPDDWAWHEGASSWGPLSSVPGATSLRLAPRKTVDAKGPNRAWIAVGAFSSASFSLIVLVATLLSFVDSSAQKHVALAPLLWGLFATAVGICLTVQFFVALHERRAGYCQVCKTPAPTIHVSLNRHVGALVLMFHRSLRGSLCKRCIGRSFTKYTTATLLLGWWGVFSCFITPIVLINNLMVYVRSQFMPPAESTKQS
jgi:hypothetical protein